MFAFNVAPLTWNTSLKFTQTGSWAIGFTPDAVCCNVDRVSDGRMIGWTGYVKRQHRYRKIAIRGARPKHTDDETRVVNATRTRAAIQRIRKAFQAGKF